MSGLIGVLFEGKHVLIRTSHAGIDTARLQTIMTSDAVAAGASTWRHTFAGRDVVVSIDTLEEMSGLRLKLAAFERLLRTSPKLAKRLLLVQVLETKQTGSSWEPDARTTIDESSSPRPDSIEGKREAPGVTHLRSDLQSMAESINARFEGTVRSFLCFSFMRA